MILRETLADPLWGKLLIGGFLTLLGWAGISMDHMLDRRVSEAAHDAVQQRHIVSDAAVAEVAEQQRKMANNQSQFRTDIDVIKSELKSQTERATRTERMVEQLLNLQLQQGGNGT